MKFYSEMKQEAMRKAEAEIEYNKDKRGMGAGDKKYFRRHDTTSRVHAEWDNEARVAPRSPPPRCGFARAVADDVCGGGTG